MSRTRRTPATLLLLAALAAGGRPVHADEDLKGLLSGLAKAGDPEARRAAVPKLVLNGTPAAAGALARLVRQDPDVGVRAAAADGLGRVALREARDLLLEQARAGGTRRVREAVARALAARGDAGTPILDRVRDRRTPEPERLLLLETLAWFRDEETRQALIEAGRGPPSPARDVAWRALARRSDAPDERRLEMIRLLGSARDEASALAALDAFLPAAHPDLRPVVARHATSLEPAVQAAAEHFLGRIRATEAAKAEPLPNSPAPGPAPGERYAPPHGGREQAPPPPTPEAPPLARYDLVYVVDVTGSTTSTLPGLKQRMRDQVGLLAGLGSSVRVGVVAYRDGPRGGEVASLEILPPTFDRRRFEAFVAALAPRGTDACGAGVTEGLREALDRTPWRWDAVRHVQLLADTGCDDPRAAGETVGFHFRSDGTRTRVAYVLRTRGSIPPEFADLARAGGTGVPEALK